MGTSYNPILAIGKEFENRHEAEAFLRDNDFLKDITEEDISDNCLEECLPCNMDGGPLNYFTGYGYYIGYRIRCRDPESFRKDFEEGMENWDEAFGGNEPADIIHTVRVS